MITDKEIDQWRIEMGYLDFESGKHAFLELYNILDKYIKTNKEIIMDTPRRKHNEKLLIKTWADETAEIQRKSEMINQIIIGLILFSLTVLILFLFNGCSYAESVKIRPQFICGISLDKWADSIYIVEGGKKTKYPYGIRAVHTRNASEARIICKRTILHKYRDWAKLHGKTSKTIDFIDYLADRYCPKSADPQGNINWKANMHRLLEV